jgi:hypothetical protein
MICVEDQLLDIDIYNNVFLNLGVCILLHVLDQVQGFASNATLFQ